MVTLRLTAVGNATDADCSIGRKLVLHWTGTDPERRQHNIHSNRQSVMLTSHKILLLLQELVEDVAGATSSRHADLSWLRRFAVASPRFIGRRSASTVLSQDCLGRPAFHLQSPGESIMQASRARWWSCQGSARRRYRCGEIFTDYSTANFPQGQGLKWDGMGRYGIRALPWPPEMHAAISFVR